MLYLSHNLNMVRKKSIPVKKSSGLDMMWYNRKTRRSIKVGGSRMRKRRMNPLVRQNKRARKEVGHPISFAPTTKQRVMLLEGAIVEQSRVQNVLNLVSIPHGNLGSTREKNKVDIKSFKIKFFLQNTTGAPIYFRYAIIVPRDNITPLTTNFFLGPDGTERGLDFANARTGIQFCFGSINPDKYHILKSGAVKLIGNTSTDNKGNNTQLVQFYYPLNRVFTWDNDTTLNPNGDNCFLVWWYDNPLNATGIVPSNVAVRAIQAVTYFRDD